MARGRGRGRGAATKRKGKQDDAPPAKLQRQDSANTQIRKAINEVKKTDNKNKVKKFKCHNFVLNCHPQATIHEDYTCMLNQTNIGDNNNKFYIIQVSKEKEEKFMCFTRWGRVGETGQKNLEYFKDLDSAIKAFEKKFKDKTKNNWDARDNFTPKSGKYTMIEIDEESDDDEDTTDGGTGKLTKELIPTFTGKCNLHIRTQIMIKLIFSEDMFVSQMSTMNIDVKKMPLGKLSKVQIAKGLETLIDIEEAIKKGKPRQDLMDLSSKFYTLMPHAFGRSVPPVIDTDSVVQQKKEVMLTLSDIELTQSLQKSQPQAQKGKHPLLEKYEMLDCSLVLVDKNDSEFKLLNDYAIACHGKRKALLLDVWRVDRATEDERFSIHDDLDNRKLLWHGTNVAVVAAILKAGLRIMPHSGGLVGKGIYFASEHSKSAWHAGEHNGMFEGEKNVGFMFLVEVALGKESSITRNDWSLVKAPPGYHSIVARGWNEPDPKKNKKVEFGGKQVVVPVGKPVPQKEWKGSHFDQTEYVIYKESQARIRYVLKFSFQFQR